MSGPQDLKDIVPEYRSRNPLVRWLFYKRLETAMLLAELAISRTLDILDAGCGEGALLKRLREEHPQHRLSGMDSHPGIEGLAVPGARVWKGDLSRPAALPAGAFDRVFCLDVLEHLQELDEPLRSVRTSLRPGGLLVLTAPSENLFHKACRLALKGTASESAGPAAGVHYHRATTLFAAVTASGFVPTGSVRLPMSGPFTLIEAMAFRRAE